MTTVASLRSRPGWRAFLTDEKGVSSLEFGLLAAGVALAIIATLAALGTDVAGSAGDTSNAAN